ncbi:zinc ribbon domain-containing protein [Robinsoniella peoriensis]|uniref:zinc ribbon domain-containing protein n=1 Tax=Robinsoniella peoriensis TaxID=180332 RepID=UPI003750DBB2
MTSDKKKKYMIIGIVVLFAAIVIRAAAWGMKEGIGGISLLAAGLLIVGLLCALLVYVCICIWIYRDCAKRGENGLLWMIIVFIATPILGIIIYMITRGENRILCRYCGYRIKASARYCENCGEENQGRQEEMAVQKSSKGFGFMIAAILSGILMIGCFISFVVLAFTTDDFLDKNTWNTGIIMASIENKWGDDWNLSFKYASEGFRKSAKFRIDDNQAVLHAQISCEEGQLIMHIIQDEKEEIIDVSNLKEPLVYPLTEYQAGKILVVLEINGAKNVKSKIEMENPGDS